MDCVILTGFLFPGSEKSRETGGERRPAAYREEWNMMSEMDRFPQDQVQSYYIIGESRTNADNAITKMYGSFYMAFEVDEETEQVLDFGCTHTLQLTEEYLKRLFIGRNFPKIDSWLEKKLEQCYGGSSRKAVLVAYQNALKRYQMMRRGGKKEPV